MEYYIEVNNNTRGIVLNRISNLEFDCSPVERVKAAYDIVTINTDSRKVSCSIANPKSFSLTSLDILFTDEFAAKVKKEISRKHTDFVSNGKKYTISNENIYNQIGFVANIDFCRDAIEAFNKR